MLARRVDFREIANSVEEIHTFENECAANRCDICGFYLDIGEWGYEFFLKGGKRIFTCQHCGEMISFLTDKIIYVD